MSTTTPMDVIAVGGGVAGRSAAVFTARHGLDRLVLDAGESILRRNAHLETVPGFPAGIDARQVLDLLDEQVANAGAEHREAIVTRFGQVGDGFTVETDAGERYRT